MPSNILVAIESARLKAESGIFLHRARIVASMPTRITHCLSSEQRIEGFEMNTAERMYAQMCFIVWDMNVINEVVEVPFRVCEYGDEEHISVQTRTVSKQYHPVRLIVSKSSVEKGTSFEEAKAIVA
jgi:hypothetical protein